MKYEPNSLMCLNKYDSMVNDKTKTFDDLRFSDFL